MSKMCVAGSGDAMLAVGSCHSKPARYAYKPSKTGRITLRREDSPASHTGAIILIGEYVSVTTCMNTCNPAAASWRAISRPIPRLAPVTKALRSCVGCGFEFSVVVCSVP